MDAEVQQTVRQLFSKYDGAIQGIKALIHEREKMDFISVKNSLEETFKNPPSYS